ncbi:MAG TPA: class I SAM-dependent methyltransferase [Drouetiella sp.]
MIFSKKSDASSYNEFAGDYATYISVLAAPLAAEICRIASVESGQNILDVGSGTGVSSLVAAQKVSPNGSVIGIDFSEGMLQQAQRMTTEQQNLKFQMMDAENLKFQDNTFDAVISLCAILHFPNVKQALAEMFRVVKLGGKVVVSYGAGSPFAPIPSIGFKFKRAIQLFLLKYSFAPELLHRVAESRLTKETNDNVLTEWSQNNPSKQIETNMHAVGFTEISQSWFGHDVEFDSAENFWRAQISIVTDIRKRVHNNELMEQLRKAVLEEANRVLNAGGKLIYPYGARYFVGTKPKSAGQ